MKKKMFRLLSLVVMISTVLAMTALGAEKKQEMRERDIYYILEDENGNVVDSGFHSANSRVMWNYEIPNGYTMKFIADNPNGLWAEMDTVMDISYTCTAPQNHIYSFFSKTYGEQYDFTYQGNRTSYAAEYHISVSDYYYAQIKNISSDSMRVKLSISY